MPVDITQFGRGAIHLPDARDYSVGAPAPYDWSRVYVPPGDLTVHNQNGSLSCVGQTTAEMAQVMYLKKYGTRENFSARFIYSQIALAQGGAYCRDGMKILTNLGCALEQDYPSMPETEEHMRDTTHLDDAVQRAKGYDIYTQNAYASVPTDIDSFAAAIRDHGCMLIGVQGNNDGWHEADVEFLQNDWGHAIMGIAPVMHRGQKCIQFLNHWSDQWGDGGYGYLSENYFKQSAVQCGFVVTNNFTNPLPGKAMEYLNNNNNKVVMNSQTGELGLIKDGKVLVTSAARAGQMALMALIANGDGGVVPPEMWAQFDKSSF